VNTSRRRRRDEKTGTQAARKGDRNESSSGSFSALMLAETGHRANEIWKAMNLDEVSTLEYQDSIDQAEMSMHGRGYQIPLIAQIVTSWKSEACKHPVELLHLKCGSGWDVHHPIRHAKMRRGCRSLT